MTPPSVGKHGHHTSTRSPYLALFGSGGGLPNGIELYNAYAGPTSFVTSGTARMRIDSSGSVGIGTAIPAVSLTVVGEVQVSNSGAVCNADRTGANRYVSGTGTQVCNSAAWTTLAAGAGASGTGSATAVAYWNGANSLSYDSDGFYWDATNNRLGLGTNAPTALLSLGDASAIQGKIRLQPGAAGAWWDILERQLKAADDNHAKDTVAIEDLRRDLREVKTGQGRRGQSDTRVQNHFW